MHGAADRGAVAHKAVDRGGVVLGDAERAVVLGAAERAVVLGAAERW